jgi:hypothetical protein
MAAMAPAWPTMFILPGDELSGAGGAGVVVTSDDTLMLY